MNRPSTEGWVILTIVVGAIWIAISGATPKPSTPSICIYEVSISMVTNDISIGWTAAPCQDIDMRITSDYYSLMHSHFQPVCPIFSVQAWPGVHLPVVDYAEQCDLDFPPLPRQADISNAIIERN